MTFRGRRISQGLYPSRQFPAVTDYTASIAGSVGTSFVASNRKRVELSDPNEL